MEIEKEVTVSSHSVDGGAPVVRKAWETPRFDRQEVRSITKGLKDSNSVEVFSINSGPMS